MDTAIKILSSFICFMMLSVPTAFSLGPERRQEQFSTIPGYLVFPAPYVFPGIGEGLMLVGYSGNFLETTIDAYLVGFSGDAAGLVGSVDEVFVVPELIYFSGWKFNISKYGINSYSSRGMESEKDDFNIIVGNKFEMDIFKVSLSLFERRLEAALLSQTQYGESHKILDSKGNLLNEIDPPQTFQGKKEGIELQLDWTDDFKDPRTGLRLKSTYDLNTSEDADSPEYYLTSHGLTFYQPVFGESTWAFHFFRSDAKVRKEGYTDLKTALLAEGFNEENATSWSYAPTSEACAPYVNKAKIPSTPTVTEQPIRSAVKTVCVLTLATVTRPRTPCFMERNCAGTSIRAPRCWTGIFSAMSCRPCRQRFFGNREASPKKPRILARSPALPTEAVCVSSAVPGTLTASRFQRVRKARK
ncbi:MAG: hypothetical protein VYC97_10400 [SAR324 cluster bacterium]|nr:hypothetical protein [SAR324 cluster bacterium]